MGAAAAQCSGVPCLKLLCKFITEPGMKSTAFEVRQQSFLCWIRKGSFQALHWWLSGLHSSPAVMEEPLRPAGKPRCEQKVHCAPTPGHVRSGWPELTEMIFFSNMCRFTFHLWWENAAGTKPRGDGDNQHCPPQLGTPQAAVGSRLPTGPGSTVLCWARGFSLRGCSHWDLLKSKYKVNPFPSCGLLFLRLVKLICQRHYWTFFFMQVG